MAIESLNVNQIKLMRTLKLKRGIPRQEIRIKFGWTDDTLDKATKHLRGFFILVKPEERNPKGGRPRHFLSLNEAGAVAIKAFDLANKNGK